MSGFDPDNVLTYCFRCMGFVRGYDADFFQEVSDYKVYPHIVVCWDCYLEYDSSHDPFLEFYLEGVETTEAQYETEKLRLHLCRRKTVSDFYDRNGYYPNSVSADMIREVEEWRGR